MGDLLDTSTRLELADLVQRYAYLVDAARFDEVTGLFTEQGVLVAPDPPEILTPVRRHTGPEEIGAELSQLTMFVLTSHGVLGQAFTAFNGSDRATADVKGVAHHVRLDERTETPRMTDLVWHLRYSDEYVRQQDRWLFAQRRITIDLIEVRPIKRANTRTLRAQLADPGWETAADPLQRGTEASP